MRVLENEWAHILTEEFQKPYYIQLREKLKEEYASHTIFPNMYTIFNALHYTDYGDVKVVILGQDPYHGPNQAHGLSFSVLPGVQTPPSLKNIYKELQTDIGCDIPSHGYLTSWAKQGVLLLNTVLTVRASEAYSHKGLGWEKFTDEVICKLNERDKPIVFILWGRHAQAKKSLITNTHHKIIESVHPSPLSASRGFFGSRPFSQANAFLRETGQKEIQWCLPKEVEAEEK